MPSREELERIAERVLRLFPDRRQPEWFHLERHEIAHALKRLARRIEAGAS
jgi:hypothetical protein